MIRDGKTIRLTKAELNALRRDNARNGNAVNDVTDTREYLDASLGALDPATQEDLLEFLETGSSPNTRKTTS